MQENLYRALGRTTVIMGGAYVIGMLIGKYVLPLLS